MQHLMELQAERLASDGEFCKLSVSDMPVVHPKLVKVSCFNAAAQKAAKSRRGSGSDRSTEISFDDILDHMSGPTKSVALTGVPGAGKTTLSKRLCQSRKTACFFMKLQQMDYQDEKMTLRQLLLDKVYPQLGETLCAAIYRWIEENQTKCIILFDGFDHSRWTLERNPNNSADCEEQTVPQLIGSLFAKQLLPDVRLIFTSRPHSLFSMPLSLRPDVTIAISDFNDKNTKLLFHALAGSEAGRLWKMLEATCPEVLNLCHNPLMMHIIVSILLANSESFVGKTWTNTRVFSAMIRNLACTEETTSSRHNLQEVKVKLAKIAFDSAKQDSVVITSEQFKAEKLEADAVANLGISISRRTSTPQRLLEEQPHICFAHESLQEYFAAVHLLNKTSQKLLVRLPKFVTNNADDGFFSPRWSLVRRFFCGLLSDPEGKHYFAASKVETIIRVAVRSGA